MAKRVVGVRFKKAGRMYYFDPGDLQITESDGVIVETSRGIEYGEVVLSAHNVEEDELVAPLKEVVRIATEEDSETNERNLQLEEEAFTVCQEKIAEHALDMKLVDVEYTFNGSKITFFFTSEGRVDFRELVKDLAHVFKTRIELRQIGVRDEAKMLGGLGSCGLPICCKTFLEDFQPVSIKMAKEQNLSLSPTKISGLCGRLMCCLKYEQEAYENMRKLMPRINREVITADGRGTVLDNNVITEKSKVRVLLSDGTLDVREYHFTKLRKPGNTPEEDDAIRAELAAHQKARAEEKRQEESRLRYLSDDYAREQNEPAPETPKCPPERNSGMQSASQTPKPACTPCRDARNTIKQKEESNKEAQKPPEKSSAQALQKRRKQRSGRSRRKRSSNPAGGENKRD